MANIVMVYYSYGSATAHVDMRVDMRANMHMERLYSCGLQYSHDKYNHGKYSYGKYNYGDYSHGQYSHGQ